MLFVTAAIVAGVLRAYFQRVALRPMPRDGAIIFSDLIAKLDVLRVACTKCERAGSLSAGSLNQRRWPAMRSRGCKVTWHLDESTISAGGEWSNFSNVHSGIRVPISTARRLLKRDNILFPMMLSLRHRTMPTKGTIPFFAAYF